MSNGMNHDLKAPALDVSNLNPRVLEAEYAVRGQIAVRSQSISQEIDKGVDHPFPKIVQCNIGAICCSSFREKPRF